MPTKLPHQQKQDERQAHVAEILSAIQFGKKWGIGSDHALVRALAELCALQEEELQELRKHRHYHDYQGVMFIS